MKRKVIQIANSTQLVALPRKWAIQHNIKKGDELELEEDGNKVIIYTEKNIELDEVEINITGLDRTSIMLYIRSMYKRGYNSIKVTFNEQLTPHFRSKENKKVITIIHTEINRLVGVEVIQQSENTCTIKNISQIDVGEFDTVVRRIFLLLIDASKDFKHGIKNNDLVLLETIEEKHDTITKFISYCLRMLNMHGYTESNKTPIVYHILSAFDIIIDVIKYSARAVIKSKKKYGDEFQKVLEKIHRQIVVFYALYYKFSLDKILEMSRLRDEITMGVAETENKKQYEIMLLNKLEQISLVFFNIVEARMSLEK